MKKRLFCILSVVLVISGVLPAFAATDNPENRLAARQDDEPLKIGLVTDVGDVDDGGFNQSAWEGVLLAQEELDAEVDYRRTIDPADREANIAEFADQEYDIIVTVGFALQEATAAAAELYPEIQFIGVDMAFDSGVTNLTGLTFPEDRAGFLAGVLAAGLTETGIVGGVYGTEVVPAVARFHQGYESGVRWAAGQLDKEITILSESHPEGPEVAFVDEVWGATNAFVQLDEGADVVFAAAGQTGNAALIEVAANVDEDPLFCIGVDTDQWNTVEDAQPCLVSSAQKLITQGVFDLILGYAAGTITSGNFVGDVGLAPFHDFEEVIPAELQELLIEVDRGLDNGAILTCYNLDLSGLQIGVVTDVGVIDDNNFNEGTYRGVLTVGHCGATVDYIETQSTDDYAINIAEFADQGFHIIVTVGWALQEATTEAAAAYPEIRFIGVDQIYEEPVPGVTGLVFYEDQAGYLAGVLAANLTESGTLGVVLGTDQSPQIRAFAAGFENGAVSVNEDIEVISTFHPGGFDESFIDPAWGATTAEQALNNGADVIFAAAGQTGDGAIVEVASTVTDGNPPYCIGVDVDQWLTVPEAQPCLVSSAMKLLDAGIATLILQTVDNTIKDGNYFGQVGLAPFHDFEDVVPDEVQADLEELAGDLSSGQVTTGFTYGE